MKILHVILLTFVLASPLQAGKSLFKQSMRHPRLQVHHVYMVPYCGPNQIRTTGPNRGINAIPNRVSTPLPERVGNPAATHHITGRRGGMPQWVINPYARANRESVKRDDGGNTKSVEPPDDFTKFNRLMNLLEND